MNHAPDTASATPAPISPLTEAAALLRTPGPQVSCDCGSDDNWFDRSVCPEPCNMMHTRCSDCGRPLGGCAHDEITRMPTSLDLALAALFESTAQRHGPLIECGNKGCRDKGLSGMHCADPCEDPHEECLDYATVLAVAVQVLNERMPVTA